MSSRLSPRLEIPNSNCLSKGNAAFYTQREIFVKTKITAPKRVRRLFLLQAFPFLEFFFFAFGGEEFVEEFDEIEGVDGFGEIMIDPVSLRQGLGVFLF